MSVNASYPFEQDVTPIYKDRITISDVPENLKTTNFATAYTSLFPDILTTDCCYNIGSNKNGWLDLYESVYIYCCENRIPNFVFIWSNLIYKHYRIDDYNWKQYFTIPSKNSILNNFTIGYQLLISKSLRSTLKEYSQIKTIQVFVNGNDEYEKVSESRFVPSFNFDNFPAFDVVKEQNINLYIEAGHSVNIVKNDEIDYMVKLIKYSTANFAKGVIFEVSSHRNLDFQVAINALYYNIVNSVRKSKFSPDQNFYPKILIKPISKKVSFIDNISNLIMFVENLKLYPDVFEHFGIVLNIEDVIKNSQNPYFYLKELIKHCNVESIQISNRWLQTLELNNSRDYNFIFLYKICQLCSLVNIKIIVTV